MTARFFLDKADPDSWRALNAWARQVAAAAEEAGLSRAVMELVSVRISQLNGCAYCLDLHTRYAVDAGVSAQQLAVLPAWGESGEVFDDVERAALTVGEAATTLTDDGTRVAALAAARAVLPDAQYSALQWAAVAMNAFNRVSILSGHPVRPRPAVTKEPEHAVSPTSSTGTGGSR